MQIQREASSQQSQKQPQKIQKGFKLMNQMEFINKIGQGAFGEIWHVINQPGNQSLACKVEFKSTQKQKYISVLAYICIFTLIKKFLGVPRIKLYGSDVSNNYMVVELLGQNLEQLKLADSLSKSNVLTIGIKVLTILQQIHEEGIIHRDIKPENIMTSKDDETEIFIVDFGLAKRYITNGQHNSCSQNRGLVGTARYASYRALNGYEQSRRDDLESVFYTLMYLLQGTLPWSNLAVEDKAKRYKIIRDQKENLQPELIWKDIPKCLQTYFYYIRDLDFDETPNYGNMIKIFNAELNKKGHEWNTSKHKTLGFDLLLKQELIQQYQSITNMRSDKMLKSDVLPRSCRGSSQQILTPNASKYNNFDSCSFLSCEIDELGEIEVDKIQKEFLISGIKKPILNL